MKFAMPRTWREHTDLIRDCYFCIINPSKQPQTSKSTDESDFVIKSVSFEPHLINSKELNDLVRDLNLLKSKAEILASHLKKWNLLETNVRVSYQKTVMKHFLAFLVKKTDFVIVMM